MTNTYTLYGSYASYYTAKTRTYLRKKGIPFVERLPSDPMFRNKVRPGSGSHRIPQLLTPDGQVIQDSIEILDALEPLFPQIPAFPDSPTQRSFVHLMELLASEGLVRLAWLHRWLFEENYSFVKKDFGRSFKPQGSDEDLQKYGDLIADRMMSYGLPESTPAARAAVDEQYLELLRLFERHLTDHPYFLGGHPSAADYAIMGAMHAHLGRDPAGLRMMQDNAPRTFRWVEHMIVPEIQSPEFFSRPIEYMADDEVPESAVAILRFLADNFGEQFVLGSLAFNQSMVRIDAQSGHELAPDQDQPGLSVESVSYADSVVDHTASLHGVWVSQRSQKHFQSLDGEAKQRILTKFGSQILTDLLTDPVAYPLARRNNRLTVA
ncbi:MAG: hypothetical protein GKR90_00180 [Pseudomonadales bacterium]|nr:hypothetical protein [Pseudomonadales bacterium]